MRFRVGADAHYRRARLTWRSARYALDVALSPLPCRRPA